MVMKEESAIIFKETLSSIMRKGIIYNNNNNNNNNNNKLQLGCHPMAVVILYVNKI